MDVSEPARIERYGQFGSLDYLKAVARGSRERDFRWEIADALYDALSELESLLEERRSSSLDFPRALEEDFYDRR
jgi:hypothetical protein